MIDLESARDRADWLARLQAGDPVILHTPFGRRPATVVNILPGKIMVGWHIIGDGDVTTWVHRDTGNLPGGRLFIAPVPDPEPDSPISGWEAA